MNVSKIYEGSSVVLLQMEPVFLYNIPNKYVEHIHRASDWNISAPDWYGKLLVTETDSDSCQVQFKNTNGMFGVATFTKREFSTSQVFQKVKDSSRYCTVHIQDIVSGDSAVYGIGFMNSKDMSQLFDCLKDNFGSQKEYLVSGDVCNKYTDHAQVKPDVADGFTKETRYNDHKKVKADVKNEAEKDVKCTGRAPVKVDVKDETTKDIKYAAHAPIKKDVKDEIAKDKKYSAHAPIKVDVKDEIKKDIKYAGHASIKFDVEDEKTEDIKYSAHAPIKVDVKGETTKDVKYTEHESIKVDVKCQIKKDVKYTGHAPMKVDVKGETTKDLKFSEKNLKVDIKDGITKKAKCTGLTSVKVNVSDKLNEPTEAKIKIGQSSEIKYSECKKIKRDTKINVTKKSVTHQETLPLEVDMKKTKTCDTPNSKEPVSAISKKRKIQSDNESAEDQIEVNKSTSSIVTEELDEVMDPQSDTNDNGILYQDSVTKCFTCHLCPYTSEFRSKMNFLLIHWASKHKIKKPNTCKLCNLVFVTPELRAKHIVGRHEKMCSFCEMEFSTKTKLQSHIKEHLNNDNSIEDPEPASNQTTHDQDVNNRSNIQCPDPASISAMHESRLAPATPTVHNTFTSVGEEETEVGIPYHDRNTQQLMCPFCPFLTFPLKNPLKFLFKHWKEVHNINEPYTCNFCYLNFSTAAHRLKHITALHYVCLNCSSEFGKLKHLNKHLKSVHCLNVSNPNISVEPEKAKTLSYICLVCSKQFETERYLRFHSETHISRLPNRESNNTYLCNVCGRNFDCEEILEIHLIRAHDERTGPNNKYVCPVPVCSSTFYKHKNLTHHLSIIHESSDSL